MESGYLVFEDHRLLSFTELRNNDLIEIDLEIAGGDDNEHGNDVVRAYLNYRIRQRTRFYPEFMVSVVAKWFVTPSTMTEYEYLQTLHSMEYKKGWTLNLDVQRFNGIYKAITGTTHETNNYYRANVGNEKSNVQKEGFLRIADRLFGEKRNDAPNELRASWISNGYVSDTVIDDILPQNTKNEKESNFGLFMKVIIRSGESALDWKQM